MLEQVSQFQASCAAVGTTEWCEDLLGRRVAKARALLAAIGKFLTHKALFVCSAPASGGPRFSTLAAQCRRTLSPLVSAPPTPTHALHEPSRQSPPSTTGTLRPSASPPTRSASGHAPAAYVASFSACRDLCSQLSPAFDPLDLDDGCHCLLPRTLCGLSLHPGPTFMLRVTAQDRGPVRVPHVSRPRSPQTPSAPRGLPDPLWQAPG